MREDCSKKDLDDSLESEIIDDFVDEILAKTINYDHDVDAKYISIVLA